MALAASKAAVCAIAITRMAGGVARPDAVTNSAARRFQSVTASARAADVLSSRAATASELRAATVRRTRRCAASAKSPSDSDHSALGSATVSGALSMPSLRWNE